MLPGRFRFESFTLDPRDRRLSRDAEPVALNPRYLDALVLLVSAPGQLVSKDRFLDEVWRGVPVTDEALTQCVRTLRKALGDDAARPRFIATVPKHGYRFIAPVAWVEDEPVATAVEPAPATTQTAPRGPWLAPGMAGIAGGAVAGLFGGLVYGLIGASQAGMGAISVLLVLTGLTVLLAALGGAGVGFGIAAANRNGGCPGPWSPAGGAIGGLAVGAVFKLFGVDAFTLLLGRSPGDITGAMEGALLGGAVGLGAWLAFRGDRPPSLRRGVVLAGLAGGLGGALISGLGGRLMGGSLDLLTGHFPGSRLRLDAIGAVFGEPGLGPISRIVTSSLEGALFGACVVGAMILARRRAGPQV